MISNSTLKVNSKVNSISNPFEGNDKKGDLFTQQLSRILLSLLLFFLLLEVLSTVFTFFIIDLPFEELTFFSQPNTNFFQAVYIGSKFNLQFALTITLPIVLLGILQGFLQYCNRFLMFFPLSILSRLLNFLITIYFYLLVLVIILVYIADWGHYQYLNKHLHPTVLQYFNSPQILLNTLWDSYPIIWYSLLLVVVMVVLLRLFRPVLNFNLFHLFKRNPQTISFLKKFLITTVVFFLYLLGMFGNKNIFLFHQGAFPLTINDAYFSNYRELNEISINPITYFLWTYYYKEDGSYYNHELSQTQYDEISEYFQLGKIDKKMGDQDMSFSNYKRVNPPAFPREEKPNIVFIIMESLGYNLFSPVADDTEVIPHLKYYASNGYFFKNAFSTTRRTHLSLFSIISGLPELTGIGITSHYGFQRKPSYLDSFTNYQRYFFYGGDLQFGGIRHYLKKTDPEMTIYEGYNDSSRQPVDGWGISDYGLFSDIHDFLEKRKANQSSNAEPFLAMILTSSFHIPHTDFSFEDPRLKKLDVDSADFKDYSQSEKKKLNSLHLVDQSLGLFMEDMKQSGYHSNTIYVIMGDHSVILNLGKRDIVRYQEKRFSIDLNHIAVIVYAPHYISTPQVFNEVISAIDVFPTVASLSGNALEYKTLGRDFFSNPTVSNTIVSRASKVPRAAFLFRDGPNNPEIRMIHQDWLLTISLNYTNGQPQLVAGGLYDLNQKGGEDLRKKNQFNQDLFADLEKYSNAIFNMTRSILFKN